MRDDASGGNASGDAAQTYDTTRRGREAAAVAMASGARVRQVLNAVNLSTALGLAVGRVGGARFAPGPYGLLLGRGYRLGVPRARAFTVGNAVIGIGAQPPVEGSMLRHEARHATQYAVLGLLVPPLYAIAAGWSWLLTGDWWSQNPFERLADLADGGYAEHPVRPWWRRRTG